MFSTKNNYMLKSGHCHDAYDESFWNEENQH